MLDIFSLIVYLFSLLVAVAVAFYLGRVWEPLRAKTPKLVKVYDQESSQPQKESADIKELSPRTSMLLGQSPSRQADHEGPRNLVVVAFALPIKLSKDSEDKGGKWKVKWNDHRSIFSNFSRFSDDTKVRFVGFPGVFVPREDQEEVEDLLLEHDCYPVFLAQDLHESFFNGFCKGILWPLFHYSTPNMLQGYAKKWDKLWQAYQAVNMIFARAVSVVTEEDDDTIWVHNYHLLLLPSFLRKKLPRAKIGIFIHTPFPTSDLYRCIPSSSNILRALLCADMVGFQTYDYARHFFSSLKRILDLDFQTMPGGGLGIFYCGRSVSVRINHVGIPSDHYKAMAESAEVRAAAEKLREKYRGRKIVLAVDDLDPVKGILYKVQAIMVLFERYPEWIDNITFVQVVESASSSADLQNQIWHALQMDANLLKDEFNDDVIDLIGPGELPLHDLIALYSVADVGLISTFWDGLNICPFEFTACQDASHPGALIVSEFMGCSRSLSGTATINPLKLEQVAEAVHSSLSQSKEERVAHHIRRFDYVMRHTFDYWCKGFLDDLDHASEQSRDLSFVQVGWGSNVRLIGLRSGFSHLEEDEIIASFRGSKRRLLLLDYDGTLTAESNPRLAAPTQQVLKYLRILSEDPHNLVFILSGRERRVLDEWFMGLDRLGLAAEKGVYYKWPSSSQWQPAVSLKNFAWKETALHLMEKYTERTDGSHIEPKESAIVWHYEAADPEYGKMQASELGKYLEKVLVGWPGIEVVRYDYNRILEVKPHGINKGVTVKRIIKQLGKEVPQFVLCVGDDRSDEDMFLALKEGFDSGENGSQSNLFTACVGIKPSNAQYYLHDPSDVLSILASLSVMSAKYIKRMKKLQDNPGN